MTATLKSELRKLLTVRSTYILAGLAALFVVFFAFYIQGYKLSPAELQNPNQLSSGVTQALASLPLVFGAIIAILLMTHEYRYNTIMYTLTSSNSRSRVLLSKFVVVSGFALTFTLFIGFLSPLMTYAGVHAHGHALAPQSIDYGDLLWRGLFNGWAYITAGLLLAVLIRNQIGAIVSLFVIPTFEQVLSLLLKHHSVYLPYTALNAVLIKPASAQGTITYAHAALVFLVYLAVGWFVAWVLFLRRDATN